jgi:hypothetical protein
MKLLPPNGFPPTKPPSYGVVTQGAVALVEIARPDVRRSFCIATTATDFPPDRPSTWSGALDQVAAGSMPGDQSQARATCNTKPTCRVSGLLFCAGLGQLVEDQPHLIVIEPD